MGAKKVQSWLGVILIAWPILRGILSLAGIHLPELPAGLADPLALGSQGVGTYMLAKSDPI